MATTLRLVPGQIAEAIEFNQSKTRVSSESDLGCHHEAEQFRMLDHRPNDNLPTHEQEHSQGREQRGFLSR